MCVSSGWCSTTHQASLSGQTIETVLWQLVAVWNIPNPACNPSSRCSVTFFLTSSFFMSQRFYPVSRRNWFSLDSVRLQANGTAASFNGSRFISAPAEYSYRCQSVTSSGEDDALLVLSSANQSSSAWRLHFVDFQVRWNPDLQT